jgi:hypothetical protein
MRLLQFVVKEMIVDTDTTKMIASFVPTLKQVVFFLFFAT